MKRRSPQKHWKKSGLKKERRKPTANSRPLDRRHTAPGMTPFSFINIFPCESFYSSLFWSQVHLPGRILLLTKNMYLHPVTGNHYLIGFSFRKIMIAQKSIRSFDCFQENKQSLSSWSSLFSAPSSLSFPYGRSLCIMIFWMLFFFLRLGNRLRV